MNLFPILENIPFLSACLIGRVTGVQLPLDRQEALMSQLPFFKETVRNLLPAAKTLLCAHEVHGAEIAIINGEEGYQDLVPNVDGLITTKTNIALGITVADCAPVWIVDPESKAIGLIHSGKRGTDAGIVPKAIQLFQKNFSSQPKNLIVAIGPCIRPPCYEIDFAKMIREQAAQAGVQDIRDDEICTACHLDQYYSYRREQGKTGHMLAVAMIQKR